MPTTSFSSSLACRQLDPSIHEAACSVVYSAPRCEVQELHVVRLNSFPIPGGIAPPQTLALYFRQVKSLLGSKYGRDFIANAAENKGNCVNERVRDFFFFYFLLPLLRSSPKLFVY